MLKFIRKYQLIILVVGGSLLMVVFLLQPVLTRLSPSPLKAKVATLNNGDSFSREDVQRATAAISLLARSNPRALQDRSVGGLGLSTESETITALHWLLLAEHAREYGLVGEAGDGASWIGQIAELEAAVQTNTERQQGLHQTQEQQLQRMADLKGQYINAINRSAGIAASNMRGTMDDAYRILAEARGMYRMMNQLGSLPAFSDLQAIYAAEQMFDSTAVDAVVLNSTLITSGIEDPAQEDLEAFFQTYREQEASENEFGIGYVQPTRIQLGWIKLDQSTFMNAVKIDRVELNKIWRQNRDTYPGDFASERFGLEDRYRQDQAAAMMVEADRLIRAQVLAKTNTLTKREGIVELPEDWEANYPRLVDIAESVAQRISEQFSVSLPTLDVTLIGDRWLNQFELSRLPGIGGSIYRIGSRQIPLYSLTQFFELEEPNKTGLDVQPLLPIVDHAAEDQAGNRYYAMVLDVRKAGPADSIEDAGSEQVLSDYKSLKAFELLKARADELVSIIKSNDSLAPAIDQIMAMAGDTEPTRPSVLSQIMVQTDRIEAGRIARFVDPSLNIPAYRDAVREAAAGLDPLIDPEALKQDPIAVAVPLPRSRALALSLIIAPRPLTAEDYRLRANTAIMQTTAQELRDAGLVDSNPFTFEALSARYGLEMLKAAEDEDF